LEISPIRDVPYEIYNPMVAILVAAEKATGPKYQSMDSYSRLLSLLPVLPRLGNPSKKLNVHASQTRIGLDILRESN